MTKKQVIKVNDRHEFIAVRDWYKTQALIERTFERPEMAGNKYPTLIIEADADKLKQRPISAAGSYEVIEFESFKEANGIEVIVKPKKPMTTIEHVFAFLKMENIFNNFSGEQIETAVLRKIFKKKSTLKPTTGQLETAKKAVIEFLRQASEAANKE